MKRLLLLICILIMTLASHAQIFDFGFPSPYRERQQVQQEAITPPEYKGGNTKLNRFLEKNFQNPRDRKNISGHITVACIIGTNGKVIDTQLLQGLDRDLNDEAIRVSKKLRFKPAKQGKKKIKSRFNVTFPIKHGRLSFLELNTIEV